MQDMRKRKEEEGQCYFGSQGKPAFKPAGRLWQPLRAKGHRWWKGLREGGGGTAAVGGRAAQREPRLPHDGMMGTYSQTWSNPIRQKRKKEMKEERKQERKTQQEKTNERNTVKKTTTGRKSCANKKKKNKERKGWKEKTEKKSHFRVKERLYLWPAALMLDFSQSHRQTWGWWRARSRWCKLGQTTWCSSIYTCRCGSADALHLGMGEPRHL